MSVRFYKDKAYFSIPLKGQHVMARAACILLKYKDGNENFILTIKEKKDIVELPGGKVEITDIDIYDTMFRELWEEIILKDQLGEGNTKHLRNWEDIRNTIINSTAYDEQLCYYIFKSLKKCPMVSYGTGALKTIYFVVDITLEDAKHLINKHNAIPLSVNIINFIVNSNKRLIRSRIYKGKNTYFQSNDEIYKIRCRDFDGLPRVTHLLASV